MDEFEFGGEIAWRPTPAHVRDSNLTAFMRRHGLASLDALHRTSITDVAWFWDTMLKDLDVRFDRPYSRVVDLSRGIQRPVWCVGGEMNIVTSLLDKWAGTPTDAKPAIKFEHEDGTAGADTYAELRCEVNKTANALRELGIGKGDVVGVFMPMAPRCVIAMLAIIKVGGIFLPLFSGYGAAAISSRLNDAGAKLLFTCDGVRRRGNVVPMKPTADEAVAASPTVKHVIVQKRCGNSVTFDPARDRWWHELIDAQPDAAATERTGAEDPMMLIYTSGTTGKPKGAVHTHCGFPVKAAQDMYHGLDLKPDETLFWLTDMGWMMGPWLVFGTLMLGASMMTYDGAPDFPGPDRLWAMVQRHGVTALGISPTLVRSLLRHGEAPVRKHDVSSLRKFASTGEPWNPEPWKWLFNVVGGGKLPIINYSGGTEISGGILMGNVHTPQKPGSFAGPLPGMDVDVVDEHCEPVRGRVGELILRAPWIGMTRGFWNDQPTDPLKIGHRYYDAYWSRFPNVWVHGDWAAVDSDGQWFILGRSDDTIKVAGKRLGPAEVESILVAHPGVQEAAAIGVPDELKGQALVCFCVLKPGFIGDAALEKELSGCIVKEMGKPLAPKHIAFVRDLPKTRNAKIMRRVARAAYLGESRGDVSALENPEAVEECAKARLA